MKKPPDKYRTMRCSLKSVSKDDFNMNKLSDAMIRTNKIIIHTYQFMRLWILNKYHSKLVIPIINEDLIRMVFKSLVKDSQGPKPKGTNLVYYNEFTEFYNNTYKLLNYGTKIDGVNLSQILNYTATDILTNIENNIKLHFIKYVKKFVNSSFKKANNEILEKCEKGMKTMTRKELNKDLYEIKEDLLNNTLKCNKKYHEWINTHKINIFPTNYINSYEFDIKNEPQKYMKGMIYMCIELEKLEVKSFQFFPLRTDIVGKYIPIDTKSLIELFVDENKNEYLTDIEHKKHELWDKLFKLSIFKQKEYNFDYRISTDCFSVSIQLIHNSYMVQEQTKKLNMKNKKAEMKEKCKDMTQEAKEKYKADLEKVKKEEQNKIKLENKLKRDKEKEEFKKLSKEDKLKLKNDKKEQDKINKKYIEFPYLEDLDNDQYTELQNNNWIVADPGKRVLLVMKNKDGKKLVYSNRQHLSKTKRLKYQRLIQNHKDKNDISKIENELSKYNSKSCIYDKFKEFITNKNRINELLFEKYNNTIFRKYKWYGYINRKKAETDLIRNIKSTFGKDSILVIGDWSDKMKLNYISTPNLALKRKLAEYMKVYNLDEFRTSCLNYKTEEKCENIYLPDKKGIQRKIHSVLTFQMENKRMGCINRDMNAVNNMVKIVKTYLTDKTRPEKFKRDYKFPEEIKDDNPIISNNSVKYHHA